MRWLVGIELAHHRRQAGLSLSEAAEKSGVGRPKIGHMETSKYIQWPADVATLMSTYGAAKHDADRLASLAGTTAGKSWVAPWSNIVPDWFRTFVGLEGLAENEFVFEPILLPGLLQTADYAEAVTEATGFVRRDHSERFVSFRLARAKRLTDDDPLNLHAVIAEGALRLAVGTPEIRRAQLKHLLALAKLPNVTIQVVRPEDGPHAANTGHLVVLDFAQAQSIAYAERVDGAVYIQDPADVRTYKMAVENLKSVALSPAKSLSRIRELID
ncbi:transcriptional regulator with XRE-family HTH domain [Kibdelosporangium banguiense]|uniref:Transcriptional regulator with XRE-family HTH domain n=1 Tax=Kibdelosporangium banguiense TaxID=1365924 RepID=A0ABS4TID9_9PSEU|nr:helix-turn-helix transcriptional regulator [Kibdelosporangium banguiense]MBP2323648.1 transcriptional regulator with XRE-family HTH domain [Kibdelosporangium banguiense]